MRRREFIAGLGGAVAWPLPVFGQQAERMRRVGVLTGYSEHDAQGKARLAAFFEGLRKLGWTERASLQIDNRWGTPDSGRFRADLAALVASEPDVILSNSTAVAVALHQQTSRVPIVFVQVSDPVGNGLVVNLARPGGNLTGFTNFEYTIGSKWVELLKEIAPRLKRVAILFNPQTAAGSGMSWVQPIEAAAPLFYLEPATAPVHSGPEIERALDEFAQAPSGGLIVVSDP